MFATGLLVIVCAQDAPAADLAGFVGRRCAACHSGPEPEGGRDLVGARPDDEPLWRAVRARLAAGEMPPPTEPAPPRAEVEAALARIDAAFGPPPLAEGGAVTVRRLSRVEYENSVRELLGVELDAEAEFPSDDVAQGFDNLAAVLGLPEILMEKYLRAAERISAEAVLDAEPGVPPVRRVEAGELVGAPWSRLSGKALMLFSNADAAASFVFPRGGEYLLRAQAFGVQAGPEPARMALELDGRAQARLDVTATADAPRWYEVRVHAGRGARRVAAAFVNDYHRPQDPDPAQRDRNLGVLALEVVGPLDAPAHSAFQRRELAPDRTAREALRALAERAWRRPAAEADVERLLDLTSAAAPREERVRTALQAVLVSPRFLFRELPAPGEEALPGGALDAHDLATRLSYFVWSAPPDAGLREAAASGALLGAEARRVEARRLIADPRSTALAEVFAAQWLHLRSLARAAPDPARFPGFDEELRAAMRAEAELLFEAVLREDRPASELLSARWTFLNERLARHYGVPGVRGSKLRRVALEDPARGGLLLSAGVLAVTSNPTRTSPARRGKWVLEVLLDAPPRPPPPGVGVLDESREAASAASLRERLAAHREDAACAGCHAGLDALGLALENYDATGRFRAADEGFAIDPDGTLPDGRTFPDAAGLRDLLARDPAFVRSLARRLMVYALGRAGEARDERELDLFLASFGGREPTLADLVAGIAGTEAFARRAGGGP